jgi:uncharacterized protein YaaW (UPF0174 family)
MTDFAEFLKNPNGLINLLQVADAEDLDILVDYITDKGEGRLTLDDDICKRLVACKSAGVYGESDRNLVRKEILLFGGNTLANVYRDLRSNIAWGGILDSILPDANATVTYDEVVRDVAKHLKATFGEKDDTLAVENAILVKIFKQAFDDMSPSDRDQVLKDLGITNISMIGAGVSTAAIVAGRAGGFMTYRLAVIVANTIAKALLGRGLPIAANATITRVLGIALGPVGMVLTGLWTLADLASPASRVTVPCVIQLAYMRQKALQAATTKACPKCSAPNAMDAKFCKDCGAPITADAR